MLSKCELTHWTEAFSVNIKLFDTQHRRLVELIDRLENAMSEDRSRQGTYEILLDLVDYCNQHFATEEAVMNAYDFPLRHMHALQHSQFMKTVRNLQVRCASDEAAINIKVLEQVRAWLSQHVLGTDKLYTEHLNNRGMF